MIKKFLSIIIFSVLFLNTSILFAQIYKGPSYSVDERVEDLLSEMTLEEKIGQMTQPQRNSVSVTDVSTYFLGSILSAAGSVPASNTPEGWADMYDAFQSKAMSTRLAIPLIYGTDAVHGHNNVYGATIFPHNIGLGATRDADLIEQIGVIVAKEVAATGVDWTFAPCFSVARNERWGRTYEGFGEIPEIGELFAERYITGFQGADMAGGEHIIACAKHFVGDGGTGGGVNNNTVCSEQELRDIHIAPFISAINAGVGTVMITYSSWNSEPLHGHQYLITDVLKDELGFNGFVISDWNGIDRISGDFPNSVKTGVNAGIDMFMQPDNWRDFISTLKSLVNSGDVEMSRIDDAVRRILRVKFTFGLFENTYTDRNITNDGSFGSVEHRIVARDAARKSLVLLKNQNNILPLSPDIEAIFIAGKNANDIGNQCGGWTMSWQGRSGDITPGTTILEGIQNVVSPSTTITFSKDGTGATGHDVAIVVIGETPYAEAEGDRSDLSLEITDQTCLNNVLNTGIPVIVILVSGRPMIITDEIADWDAFVAAWLPGTEGEGVAEVLFGSYNFSGKLPCSWPSSMDQLPINYGDTPYNPLFSYGFGLTYEGWPPTIPVKPSNLVAEALSFSEVNLSWADNSDNETGFKIERKLSNGVYSNIATVGTDVVSYSDSELSTETIYYYRIKAYNGLKESDYSDETSVVTLSDPAVIAKKLIPYNNLIDPEKGEKTSINYALTKNGHVVIEIYNLSGELIKSLVDEDKNSGTYTVYWDGKNDNGRIVSSGTYLVLMKTKSDKVIRKVIIMK